jgi:2-oxoisovalerate dehydrogenase E2 component (dihydrolipoyl transacylase)
MGVHVIKMPDIGEGIAEVELVAWHIKPGDAVAEDQVLADVMTDKATVEIPSPVVGTVVALGGEIGQVMAVGSELIRIEVAGAGNMKDAPATSTGPAAPPAASTRPAAPPPALIAAPPPSREIAPATVAPATRQLGEKPVASPAVRRRAWDLGIELQFVPGSGTAGRITHDDLDAYLKTSAARRPGSGAGAAKAESRYAERTDEERISVLGLRRKIAQKM